MLINNQLTARENLVALSFARLMTRQRRKEVDHRPSNRGNSTLYLDDREISRPSIDVVRRELNVTDAIFLFSRVRLHMRSITHTFDITHGIIKRLFLLFCLIDSFYAQLQ